MQIANQQSHPHLISPKFGMDIYIDQQLKDKLNNSVKKTTCL